MEGETKQLSRNEELEAACVRLSREVYDATVKHFETLESKKKIFGNGHHAAQKLAAHAVEELRRRWI